ncbi:hypothetical protein DQ384_16990 [Sphaerisporangium album]|uniref:Uncharacterized protein n=1 Tax=Sphaerisporangium album TaxID=509200 RepID=A0A367FJQ7_9ACTN|nr:hypothetical protein [Sphaerisporangium album]RCG29870.1 hypothetical protein DQ384_16990 [Sphaerisporangium album]
MSPDPGGPAWTDIVTTIVTVVAVGVALWAAWKASRQADMAADSARFAGTQADAAKEQVAVGKDQLDVASRQLELEVAIRREQQEPHVVVDIVPSPHAIKVFILVIENIGPTVARNVRIAFEPPIERAAERNPHQHVLRNSRIFTEGISHMPPGRRIELLFDQTPERHDAQLPMQYAATVDAEWTGGRVETMTYNIDLSIYYDVTFHGVRNLHDGVEVLEKVKKELDEIKKKMPAPPG